MERNNGVVKDISARKNTTISDKDSAHFTAASQAFRDQFIQSVRASYLIEQGNLQTEYKREDAALRVRFDAELRDIQACFRRRAHDLKVNEQLEIDGIKESFAQDPTEAMLKHGMAARKVLESSPAQKDSTDEQQPSREDQKGVNDNLRIGEEEIQAVRQGEQTEQSKHAGPTVANVYLLPAQMHRERATPDTLPNHTQGQPVRERQPLPEGSPTLGPATMPPPAPMSSSPHPGLTSLQPQPQGDILPQKTTAPTPTPTPTPKKVPPKLTLTTQPKSSSGDYPASPLTAEQKHYLSWHVMNYIKRPKSAAHFLHPATRPTPRSANARAPPNPLDLTTIGSKLRANKYASVRAFVQDFDLMFEHAVRVYGKEHPIGQAGIELRLYLVRYLRQLPGRTGVGERVGDEGTMDEPMFVD